MSDIEESWAIEIAGMMYEAWRSTHDEPWTVVGADTHMRWVKVAKESFEYLDNCGILVDKSFD